MPLRLTYLQKKLLIAMVGGIILPLIIAMYLLYKESEDILRRNIENHASWVGRELYRDLHQFFAEQKEKAELLASHEVISKTLKQVDRSGSEQVVKELQAYLQRVVNRSSAAIAEIRVYENTGDLITSSEPSVPAGQKLHLHGTIESTRVTILDSASSQGQRIFRVLVPIVDRTSGGTIGVLSVRRPLSLLDSIFEEKKGQQFTDATATHDDNRYYVVDSNSTVIAGSRSVIGMKLRDSIGAFTLRNRNDTTGEFIGLFGNRRILHAIPLAEPSTVLVISLSEETLFQPLQRLGLAVLLIAGIGIVTVLGISLFMARRISAPITVMSETAHRIADGDWDARVHTDSLRGEMLSMAEAFNNMVDVRNKSFQAMHISEQRWSSLVDNTPDTILILDRSGTIRFANRTMSGVPTEDLLGRQFVDLFTENHTARHFEELFTRFLDTGDNIQDEWNIRLLNGTIVCVNIQIVPIRSGDMVTHGLMVTRDITEQRRLQKELEKSERHYRALIEKAHDVIALIDENGRILFDSPSVKIALGYDPGEQVGLSTFERIHPEDLETVQRAFLKLSDAPGSFESVECRYRAKDGRWVWIEANGRNLLHDETVKAIVVNYRNIDKKKQFELDLITAKEQAERADRYKDYFIANISHEIRTPLNIILGYSNLLRSTSITNDPDEREAFVHIDHAGHRLMRTVEQVLNISSFQAGTFRGHSSPESVLAMVSHVMRSMKHAAEQKHISFILEEPAEDLTIEVDRYCFEQGLINLLENAIKFTPKGGVYVGVRRMQNEVQVSIRDTGIGISREYLPLLYEAFSQEASGYTRPYEGLGLGLALVKHYTELNHGSIAVHSEKGKGTTFTLTYPVSENEPDHTGSV